MSINIKKVIIVWIPAFAGMTIVGVILLFLFGNKAKPKLSAEKKLMVTASFYPLSFLAERIGGDYVKVTTLTPSGVEPHDFEPSTRDIAQIENQDIVLLNGGGLEGYVEKIKSNIDSKKTAILLVAEQNMSIKNDPHTWLDPLLFQKEALSVRDIFIQKDPKHKKQYILNSDILLQELGQLDVSFRKNLRNCSQKNIITAHSAFSYIAKQYGFNQITLTGLSPEEEPSSQTLARVTSFAKKNKISYIFFEELISPAGAETIAKEIGAKTLVLSPVEGLTNESKKMGKTYLSIQKENIENLQIGLNCSQ